VLLYHLYRIVFSAELSLLRGNTISAAVSDDAFDKAVIVL
jgi:hypothetical protein